MSYELLIYNILKKKKRESCSVKFYTFCLREIFDLILWIDSYKSFGIGIVILLRMKQMY